ncbi:MAG: TadE/TadG family type IV pilus assembly protein [Propionicimonas sp.]|nr:TadE/TadG family type IV pilus assembly protein [Propionicimonas sp.]
MKRRRDERGSAAVEVALLAPVLGLMVLAVIFAGRVAVARQAVQSATTDAVRAASLARTADDAKRSANRVADAALVNQDVECATTTLEVDTSGFRRPPGTAATVTVTLTCEVATADLSLPVPGTIRIEHSMSSPLDVYRGRR